MIYDNIANIRRYKNLTGIYEALAVIKDGKVGSVKLSENIKINYNKVLTENENVRNFETHSKYADIHYCISGTEKIQMILNVDELSKIDDYNADIDIQYYEEPKTCLNVILNEGDFLVVYPEQGHKPCCSVNKASELEKYVVKIKMK